MSVAVFLKWVKVSNKPYLKAGSYGKGDLRLKLPNSHIPLISMSVSIVFSI